MCIRDSLKDEGIKPDVAAGLSLGEYSALAAAEVFEPEKAIELVRFRAEEMYKASIGVDCAMSALIGADRHIAEECCALVSEETGEIVQPANYNCPGQIVISGEAGAVAAASEPVSYTHLDVYKRQGYRWNILSQKQ